VLKVKQQNIDFYRIEYIFGDQQFAHSLKSRNPPKDNFFHQNIFNLNIINI